MNTEGKTPMKTMAQADLYPIPKSKMTKGIQAIGGGKRGASSTKFTMKFFFKKPGILKRRSPKRTPKKKARLPPQITRRRLAQEFKNISVYEIT